MKIALTGWLHHVGTEEIELWFNGGNRITLNQDSVFDIKKLWDILILLIDDQGQGYNCRMLPLAPALDLAVQLGKKIEWEDLDKILQ